MDNRYYEFDQTQNQLFQDLARKMRFVGYFFIAIGVLLMIVGLLSLSRGGLGSEINGIILVIIGFWKISAANAFERIFKTQGSDIENLMGALGELRKLYTLQFWLSLIAIIFTSIAIIVTLVTSSF